VDHCAECGFIYDETAIADVPETLRSLAARYVELLGEQLGGDQPLRSRPAPDVWSALEYACHVRDVLLVQRDRVILALVEDTPGFSRMYRDERVKLAGYPDERPEDVASELCMSVDLFAKVFERLTVEQAGRRCIYNFPAPTERDVAWLGRHTVHEAAHHLDDVTSVLARVAAIS
jgi:hypothetical protein